MKQKKYSFFILLLIIFIGVSLNNVFAQGTVKGNVTDISGEPLPGANVMLGKTHLGAATDYNGNYEIKSVPEGKYTLKISSLGYKSKEFTITVTSGKVTTQNAKLLEDILGFNQVVVTGSVNEKTKLQSSVAITTVSAKGIEEYAPRSAADLIKLVPGFYTESSGGEGNGNVMARGLPNSGGLRYVQLQEDGLPVFEYGDLMFGNSDIWLRVDNTVQRMEGVRGGSASILTSNAPGGIINFISKTGGNNFAGTARLSVGDYGLFRSDIGLGGPIGKNIRFYMGGFYRTDQGIRKTHYTANDGGQFKGNLTYLMDNGYARLNFKYLNDRTVAYLPIPLTGDDPKGITGFDPNYGTASSVDLLDLHVFSPFGSEIKNNLSKGMNPNVVSLGGELFLDLGNNITLKNAMRFSDMDGQFNAIYLYGGPWTASDYAHNKGLTDYSYSYARGYKAGQPIANPNNLNGNGLVAEAWWWDVNIPLKYFTNNFKLSAKLDKMNVTAGYYFSQNKVHATWWWHSLLVDLTSDGTRALNLINNTNGESLTSNGFIQYGSLFYKNYTALTTINAPFLTIEYKPEKSLSLDAGIRYDIGKITGWSEKDRPYTYDVDGDGIITNAEKNVYYASGKYVPFDYDYNALSFSIGANYTFNDNLAIFGRGSNGKRAPADRTYAFGATEDTKTGFNNDVAPENIYQFELGTKYSSSHLAVFGTLFYSLFKDITFVDLTTEGAVKETYNTTAAGIEAEVIAKFGNFTANFSGTFQDLRYHDWIYNADTNGDGIPDTKFNFDGNQIQRMPKLYFTFAPSYQFGVLRVNLALQYFSMRYTSPDNVAELPAFYQLNAGAEYKVNNRFSLGVAASNITNVIGLTEGQPSAGLAPGQKPQYYYARPILGRSVTTYINYNF